MCIRDSFHVARRRDLDAVMAATTPPVFVALAARIGSKLSNASFVYHMQDIYPEVLSANTGKQLGIFQRILRKVDGQNTKRSDRVVVLSRDMKKTLGQRHSTDNVSVINNFLPDSDHGAETSTLQTTRWKQGSLQVIFAGNLGNFQGLENVVDAFKLLAKDGVAAHLVLLGSGAAEKSLRQQAGGMLDTTIFFPGRVSQAEAESAVSSSDLALVTLNSGVIGTAFPSKTMTYLSCGTPVLAAVESNSELAELLTSEKVGSSCELDSSAIAAAIAAHVADPEISRDVVIAVAHSYACLLYTSPSPRDATLSRMPSSA